MERPWLANLSAHEFPSRKVRENNLHIQPEAIQPPVTDVPRHYTMIFSSLNGDLRVTFDPNMEPA
ncbi:hypothetical protein A2U01_0086746, partial [Trifolium medium]|nr:hypothetical protein [Trifolium medium]